MMPAQRKLLRIIKVLLRNGTPTTGCRATSQILIEYREARAEFAQPNPSARQLNKITGMQFVLALRTVFLPVK
jgi:hypothetical protein